MILIIPVIKDRTPHTPEIVIGIARYGLLKKVSPPRRPIFTIRKKITKNNIKPTIKRTDHLPYLVLGIGYLIILTIVYEPIKRIIKLVTNQLISNCQGTSKSRYTGNVKKTKEVPTRISAK